VAYAVSLLSVKTMRSSTLIYFLLASLLLMGMAVWGFGLHNAFRDPDDGELDRLTLDQERVMVEDYIRANISALSPESEVLGGTFYMTDIRFTSTQTGVVEYEDGHIALIADFAYRIDNGVSPTVDLFNVRGNTFE